MGLRKECIPTRSLNGVLLGVLLEFRRAALAAEVETFPVVVDDRGVRIDLELVIHDGAMGFLAYLLLC
jgi:hypothetical protein